MADTRFRYPGAQPFRDDELARQTFFGRGAAAIALADQILAHRLVVVYAKSGVGKTSLLNAGVAPLLRDAGKLPLFLRVNDIGRAILPAVFDGMAAEAKRQNIEFVPGDRSSLWSFLKTARFWRDDILLTPVLVLDQFEELFTLQSDEARESFLSELSYVIRGVAPPSLSPDLNLSDSPPPLHVVLSLREDFLGLLEEASERIPQILDNRFRLAPLDKETAAEALECPAGVDDPNFATKPFLLEPRLVPAILDYLTKSASVGRAGANRYIEPFHLQLICQRVERMVAEKQRLSREKVIFTLQDLGGEAGMSDTLRTFYDDAITSLANQRDRHAARRLCEQYLINPEGRRLSVEARELQEELKISPGALDQLADRRLLRTDRRADSTYYELSHDALVQAILARGRTQAMMLGWLAYTGGIIILIFAWMFALISVLMPIIAGLALFGIDWTRSERSEMGIYMFFAPLLYGPLAYGLWYAGKLLLRRGKRAYRLYKRRPLGNVNTPGRVAVTPPS